MNHYKIFTDAGRGLFSERLDDVYHKVKAHLASEQFEHRVLCYAKVFLSDISNQEEILRQSPLMTELISRSACTIVQQPPVNGAKIGLLLKTSDEPDNFMLSSLRLSDGEASGVNSYDQTIMLFNKYLMQLEDEGLKLKDHCVRTWIYVRDIDANYDGVVKARNDIFCQHGLTPDTHFIASTGIGGRTMGKNVCVAIDFLTARSIRSEDKLYLKALDHLNPTHEYGVAFERGVRMTLPHKYQYFISGTASINHRGEVVHVGDVMKQTARLLKNIEALLADGGATMGDVSYFIVYLRDLADASAVEAYMAEAFPTVPRIITHAEVCRPAWLVEMECIAECAR